MSAASDTNKDRVFIFDTTLRDGEQSPGATMTLEEKLQVAEALDVPHGTVASRLRRARAELENHVTRHLARTRFRGVLP